MLELTIPRKNKVGLSDYNSHQDVERRMLMSDFSSFDLQVLEEILFNPLKISFKKFARSLQTQEDELLRALRKLEPSGLLSVQEDLVVVDKDVRKYFEFQIQRFSADFKPDMEFLQGLLRNAPIHLLPIWYSIPRSSNNIFESIVEKYLLTPQIFQRYLNELSSNESISQYLPVVRDLFSSPTLMIASSDVIAKYNLTRRGFEEMMLLLEFHFLGTVRYEREEDHWHEVITPFHEWRQYLSFVRDTRAEVPDPAKVKLQKGPEDQQLKAPDRSLREAEKLIQKVLHGHWILFDQFIQGARVPLHMDSVATLKKTGTHWKYVLPVDSEEEKQKMHMMIFKTLFESGLVAVGTYEGQSCFAVTALGRSFFEG